MNESRELVLEGEEWRAVEKFPGYEVSNLGRFRSYWTPTGLSDTPKVKSVILNRYMKVSVRRENGTHTLTLFARLVAEAFLGKPGNRIILYLDDDITNCQLSNLAYVTREEFGKIQSMKRYLSGGVNSAIGKEKERAHAREVKLYRALEVKRMRDQEKLSFKKIGSQLGISESGAFRIYRGSHNHMLAKALAL